MGRHAHPPDPAPEHPGARQLESLPGWGLFATTVGAGCVAWSGAGTAAVTAVAGLGCGSTALLWWAVRRTERGRRTGRRPDHEGRARRVTP